MENELFYEFSVDNEIIMERFSLCRERLDEMKDEHLALDKNSSFDAYFHAMTEFLLMVLDNYDFIQEGGLDKAELSELKKRNHELYQDILPENYEKSYGNPTFAVAQLGEDYGKLLSVLCFELRSIIRAAFENNLFFIVIRLELFIEIFGAFLSDDKNGGTTKPAAIRDTIYWFLSDYTEDERISRFAAMVDGDRNFVREAILSSDFSDVRYLYKFGEYITENEIRMAQHLNSLSQEEIDRMAFTFTEGYRIGFEVTNKDITKKKTAAIYYELGFERVVKKAIENFEKIDLKTTLMIIAGSLFTSDGSARRGASYGAIPNKQFDYDHKDDIGLFLDANLITRKLEAARAAGERYKDKARLFGGPAVIETFGEKPFSPVPNKDAVHLTKEQQKALTDYKSQNSIIMNEYIIMKERSFTIISFPKTEIGDNFEEIFNETVRINTLDYKLYQTIQQKIIDALDEAEYVIIKGMGDNRTVMKVMLHELKDPSKETNFENCVADVNIPVGEVFTSPVLTGTEGTLHVSGVYLEGLFFKNLEIGFKDGFITSYKCTNFDSEEENFKYIKENILFNHDTLPIGEFAIGTNTTAYVVARKFGIEDKLPILIAEKTGPHFAVGDTCYTYDEDNETFNPDGKSIIARDNEWSIKRKTEPDKAYFNCHTDITLPYDELGEISAVRKDGSSVTIIKDGRFVLEGTEELNRPMDECAHS
ncbi:MAG: aminopeptidase [Butyrivibrio sp.]|nr:aminopeptidase [Butyrivibrio sp.]